MAEVGTVFVTVAPSAKGFGKKLEGEVGGDLDSSGKKSGKKFGAGLALGATAVVGGAVIAAKFLGGAIEEAREAQKVGALTAQVIKTTGGAANVSADQVGKLSQAISNKTGIDDEAVQSGANLLLTFKDIRNETGKGNDIFNQATQTITDMGAAMGKEPKAAAIQLGKALNDPIKGVGSLSRVGVQFTEQQKGTIKSLVESGDKMGAQKIILKELKSEFGGAAAASATAGDKLKVAWGNLQETVGTALLPLLDSTMNFLAKIAIAVSSNIGPAFAKFGTFIQPAVTAVKGLFAQFSGSGGQASALVTTQLLPALRAVGGYLMATLVPIFTRVGTIISTQVVPILAFLGRLFLGTIYPAILRIYAAIAVQLKPVFDQLAATIRAKILPTISYLLAQFRQAQPTIQKVVKVLLVIIRVALTFAAAILGRVLPVVIKLAGFLIGALAHAIVFVIRVIARIIGNAIAMGRAFVKAVAFVAQFQAGVLRIMGKVLGFVAGIPGKITHALGSLGSLLFNAGQELVQGLINGITAKLGALASKVGELASKVKGFLPGSPVKEGPLKSWNNGGAGKRLVGLLADGLEETSPIDAAMARLTSRVQVGAPRFTSALAGGGSDVSSMVAAGVLKVHVVNSGDIAVATDGRADMRVAAHAGVSREAARARR